MKSRELNTNIEGKKEDSFREGSQGPYMEYGELSSAEQEKMEIVTEQFNNPKFVEIPIPGNEKETMKIEYVVLDARGDQELDEALKSNERTVVHVPGFTASYRSPERFTKLMAVR